MGFQPMNHEIDMKLDKACRNKALQEAAKKCVLNRRLHRRGNLLKPMNSRRRDCRGGVGARSITRVIN
jgi:hypothetical protein